MICKNLVVKRSLMLLESTFVNQRVDPAPHMHMHHADYSLGLLVMSIKGPPDSANHKVTPDKESPTSSPGPEIRPW